jgi:hypothetical protein
MTDNQNSKFSEREGLMPCRSATARLGTAPLPYLRYLPRETTGTAYRCRCNISTSKVSTPNPMHSNHATALRSRAVQAVTLCSKRNINPFIYG